MAEKIQTEAQMEQKATARVATAAQEAAKEDLLNQKYNTENYGENRIISIIW